MAKKPAKTSGAPGVGSDLDILRQLVAMLDGSSATSIKLQRGEAAYEVSRGATMPVFVPGAAPAQGSPAASAPAAAAPAAAPEAKPSNLIEIKSPMVGTFYRSPEPGAEPYLKAGSRVAPGQTLCIIEAMKIMNELESEVSGVVREILVEDAQPVEFGQVLFRVEP
jgi:acetyl-CoA carboxylase biotin carboxyl carrier protein